MSFDLSEIHVNLFIKKFHKYPWPDRDIYFLYLDVVEISYITLASIFSLYPVIYLLVNIPA